MVEALKLVLKRLRIQKRCESISGICYVIEELRCKGHISEYNSSRLSNLLDSSHSNQTEFFTWEDKVVNDSSKYHWKRGELKPREDWILEQIRILEDKPTWIDEGKKGAPKVYTSRGAVLNLIKRIVKEDDEFKDKELSEDRLFEIGANFYSIYEQ